MKLSSCFFAIGLLAAPLAWAQTPDELAAVQRASAVGWEIYEHDQAAWHGTDAMLADIPDPHAEGVQGWITERTPDGVQVLFLRPQGDSVTAVYRALYRDGALREHGRIHQQLTEAQARINRARLAVVVAAPLPQQCAARYNSVTLPRATPGPDGADVDVYLMPAQATADEVPFGGHFRFAVDSGAGVVREVQRFTNGCITLPIAQNAAALMITQLVGDTPTEIHVFESLTVERPVYVVARSGQWSVEGRSIRRVSDAPANQKPGTET